MNKDIEWSSLLQDKEEMLKIQIQIDKLKLDSEKFIRLKPESKIPILISKKHRDFIANLVLDVDGRMMHTMPDDLTSYMTLTQLNYLEDYIKTQLSEYKDNVNLKFKNTPQHREREIDFLGKIEQPSPVTISEYLSADEEEDLNRAMIESKKNIALKPSNINADDYSILEEIGKAIEQATMEPRGDNIIFNLTASSIAQFKRWSDTLKKLNNNESRPYGRLQNLETTAQEIPQENGEIHVQFTLNLRHTTAINEANEISRKRYNQNNPSLLKRDFQAICQEICQANDTIIPPLKVNDQYTFIAPDVTPDLPIKARWLAVLKKQYPGQFNKQSEGVLLPPVSAEIATAIIVTGSVKKQEASSTSVDPRHNDKSNTSTKEPLFDAELPKIPDALKTTGDGDCAFHAIFGEQKPRQKGQVTVIEVFCPDVKSKRTLLANSIREGRCPQKLVNAGILALIDEKRVIGQHCEDLQRKCGKNDADKDRRLYQLWLELHAELGKDEHVEVLSYLAIRAAQKEDKTITQDAKGKSSKSPSDKLRDQLHHEVIQDKENLSKLMPRSSSLYKKFEEYCTLRNEKFDPEKQISQAHINEYASYIERPGAWLLPAELQLIAEIFKITIYFYTKGHSDVYNPGQKKEVGVLLGVSHFWQLVSPSVEHQKKLITDDKSGTFTRPYFSLFKDEDRAMSRITPHLDENLKLIVPSSFGIKH